jgi:hypothetical protein
VDERGEQPAQHVGTGGGESFGQHEYKSMRAVKVIASDTN